MVSGFGLGRARIFQCMHHTRSEDFVWYSIELARTFSVCSIQSARIFGHVLTGCDDSLGNSILDCEDFAVHAPYKINRVSGFPIQLARIF